jgi:transposase-like protein
LSCNTKPEPKEITMTVSKMALLELAQKSDDGNFLRELLQFALQRLMALEVDGLCGAGPHERSETRVNQRNGYRDRSWETRLGTLDLRIPKLRQGSYFPAFLEARKTAERALVAGIQEAWIHGVSTRKVDDLVQALGMSGISKSQVSELCREIDERVHAFLNRPIEGDWPYLWLDATYLKVREGGRVVSVAAIIASGVNRDGRREILGLAIGPSEAATFWVGFLRSLVKRGLKGVKLVISDAHEGLKYAIAQVLKATWQRCRVHFMRNALAYVPKGQHSMVAAAIRAVFSQPDRTAAGQAWRHVADQLRTRFPQACRPHGRGRRRRPGVHELPTPALAEAALDQPARTPQQGSQMAQRRRRHLPQRGQHCPSRRRRPPRAERRVATPAPLHDA